MKRRNFFKGVATGALSTTLLCRASPSPQPTIDTLELYRYDVDTPRHFSWGSWENRQHVFLRMGAGDHTGWGEAAASKNHPDLDLAACGAF